MPFVPVFDSTGAPVLSSTGSPRVACAHLAEWLVTLDALNVARGRGHVTYFQTVGGADVSAGTHLCGSAWDMAYQSDAAVMDAREMGAAVWHRKPGYNGWPSTGADHVHGVIACGDNSCNAYQYAAYWLGYNGLGLNGVAAGDPLPKPSARRTWQEGIAWAQAQMNTTTTTEDDIPKLLLDIPGTGWFLTDRGAVTIDSTADAKILRRVLDAKEYLVAEDRVLPGEIAVYQKYVARANGAVGPTTTVTVNIDDAAASRIATAVWAPVRKEL